MALAVFDKQDNDELTVQEIDVAINRYPYFAVLHYLKAGKLIAEQDVHADTCAAKTALFFHNPHWLNHQLGHQKELTEHAGSIAELMITPHDTSILEHREEQFRPEAGWMQEELEDDYDSKRIFEEDEANDTGEYTPEESSESWVAGGMEVTVVTPTEIGVEVAHNDFPASTEDQSTEFKEQAIDVGDHESGETEPTKDQEADKVSDTLIPIEPLYTIDYFASQGIKLPVEEAAGDQLAVKLRSFTEWLKSMKRIQPEKMDRQIDQETEKHIRQTAEHSNENKEVYTEALAEVYRKQGLDDKAVEVYQKLSLLDPAKSAYFAARIREIKEI
jgi:hypothetical protein